MKKILISLGLSMVVTAAQAANISGANNADNEYAGLSRLFTRADGVGFIEAPNNAMAPIAPQEAANDRDLSHFGSLYVDHCGNVHGCAPGQPDVYLNSIPWEAFQNPELLNLIGSALGTTMRIQYINQ